MRTLIQRLTLTALPVVTLAPFGMVLEAPTALAQADTSATASIEEVVVTARRREESLQDIPISISAFTSDQIEQMGMTNLQDLDSAVANLSLGGNDSTGGSNLVVASIRGVGSATRINVDGAVGLYIDDVFVPRMTGTLLDLIDVESIDVLRGPQGTLFGRNTTGGAIRYNSKNASTEAFEGYIKAGVGSFDLREVTAMFNFPLSDTAAMRVSGFSRDRDGFLDNFLGRVDPATSPAELQYVSNGVQDLGNDKNAGMRVGLHFEPTETVTIDLTGVYIKDEGNGPPIKVTDWNVDARRGEGEPCRAVARGLLGGRETRGAGVCTVSRASDPAFDGIAQSNPTLAPIFDNAFTVLSGNNTVGGEANSEDIMTELFTLQIGWDINDSLSLSSRTAYLNIDATLVNDNDFTPIIWRERMRDQKNDSFSQEFLLNGVSDRFNWTAGVYYFDETPEELTTGSDSGTPNVFIREEHLDAQSRAIFGEGTYSVTDALNLTLGYRWTKDEKELTAFGDGEIRSRDRDFDCSMDPECAALLAGDGIPSSAAGESSFVESTWRASLQYNWTDDIMTYISASSGFTSGGFNNELELKFGPSGNFGILPFDSETVDLYEIGLRSTLLDGRLRFNATYFQQEWEDRQLRKIQPDGTRFTTNAGNAETWGSEIDIAFMATDSLTLTATAGILDGEWTEVDPGVSGDILIDSELKRTPDLSYSLTLNHSTELWDGMLNTSFSYGWRDDQQSSDIETRTITIDSYGLLTGRIQYTTVDEKWAFSLLCKNCLDEDYINTGVDFTGTTANQARVGDRGREGYRAEQIGRPQEFVLEIKRNF